MLRKMLVLLGLFVVVMNCSLVESPSTVVKQFYKLAADGKLNDAYELISKEGKELLKNLGGGAMAIGQLTQKIKNQKGIKNMEILKEEIQGDLAIVNVKITYGDGSSGTETEKLIKENGKWRLSVSK